MKKYLTIFLILYFTGIAKTQVIQEWVARYNGPQNNYDFAEAMALDSFGNIYVTGAVNGFENSDFATIKYNSIGKLLWIVFYNGSGDSSDTPRCLTVDSEGNILVSGISFGSGTGLDFVTIKYNSSGIQRWLQRYSTSNNNYVSSMALDDSNNVYVAGETDNNCQIIKYNSIGIQQWIVSFSGRYISSINTDKFRNIYVTGCQDLNGSADYFTIKFDYRGLQQWIQTYNGNANRDDISNSLILDNSLNVYVTGYSITGPISAECVTIKYNSSGVQQWLRKYKESDSSGWDEGNCIALDNFNNIYVGGETFNQITSTDFLTIKYNSDGELQWTSSYSGFGNNSDNAYFIKTDGSGNVYTAGDSWVGLFISDYAIVKYSSSGIFQWVERYHNGNSYSSALMLDKYNNLYITGGSTSNGYADGYDFITIKYSQPIGIEPISNYLPSEFKLYQNYPNPFNPLTKIKFDIPPSPKGEGLGVRLVIYDALGRELQTLVNENLQPGTYETEWDGTNYSSGVYYYKLIIDASAPLSTGFIETKKMIMLK